MGKIRKYNTQNLKPAAQLSGRQFARLKVVGDTGRRTKDGKIIWHCVCKCGGEKDTDTSSLVLKRARSCGCLQREAVAKTGYNNQLPEGLAAIRNIFNAYRRRAIAASLSFSLSFIDFSILIFKTCEYCGAKPSAVHSKRRTSVTYNGLDRVDNTRGYEQDNVVPCCWLCNIAKRNKTLTEFQHWIKGLCAHQAKN